MKTKGYVQVYTGNGKGKTTAALGLAVRASGAGKRVFFAQFLKGREYSELKALRLFKGRIIVRQFGAPAFVRGRPTAADIRMARAGLGFAARVLKSGRYELVVLDEANVAVHLGLFPIGSLLKAVEGRAPHVEVVLTGRKAHPRLLKKADLITEMREVRHYYNAGVNGRIGIES